MVRTLRLHIETSIRDKIADDSPIIAWIVEHAANLLNNCKKGRDGRTPQERLHGKRIPQAFIPIGEKVMFQSLRQDKRMNKAEPRYEFGIWAGIKCGSNEVYILTPTGVARARNIRRLSEGECWDKAFLNQVQGTPWDHSEGQLDEPLAADPDIPPIITPDEDYEQVRRMKLTKHDFRVHGYTPNCPGCRALQLGKQSQPHTEACRKRMEEKISTTTEGAERLEKRKRAIDEALARHIERADKKAKEAEPERPANPSPPGQGSEPPPDRGGATKRKAEGEAEEHASKMSADERMHAAAGGSSSSGMQRGTKKTG